MYMYMYMYIHVHCMSFADDDYDEYGRSVEDDEPLSPNTAGSLTYCIFLSN